MANQPGFYLKKQGLWTMVAAESSAGTWTTVGSDTFLRLHLLFWFCVLESCVDFGCPLQLYLANQQKVPQRISQALLESNCRANPTGSSQHWEEERGKKMQTRNLQWWFIQGPKPTELSSMRQIFLKLKTNLPPHMMLPPPSKDSKNNGEKYVKDNGLEKPKSSWGQIRRCSCWNNGTWSFVTFFFFYINLDLGFWVGERRMRYSVLVEFQSSLWNSSVQNIQIPMM